MKRAFLLIVVPALLVALGFAQTPAAGTNTDQTNIKGCLGGSDGNYTVVEDGTGRIFKITTSSVDLKPHLSHDVTLIGQRASGASSAAADDSFAVTALNMISEHCAADAAAPAATVTTPAETPAPPASGATPPAETAVTPAADATPPAETVAPPAADASAPAGTVTTPSETANIPPAAGAAPAATTSTVPENAVAPAADASAAAAAVTTPSETASTPAVHPRRRSETPAVATTPAVTATSSPESGSTPAAAAATPAATSSTSSDPVSTSAPVATTPAGNSRGWSLWLWIALGALVIVIGTLFPFFNRWRKRKSLEGTDVPNLSFNREVSSVQGEGDKQSDKQGPRKAA